LASSSNRGDYHRDDLVGFLEKFLEQFFSHEATGNQQFEPGNRFIRLFFHDSRFRAKLGGGSSAASRPVVRADGRGASQELLADHVRGAAVRKAFDAAN
jgi:hypothetical protein